MPLGVLEHCPSSTHSPMTSPSRGILAISPSTVFSLCIDVHRGYLLPRTLLRRVRVLLLRGSTVSCLDAADTVLKAIHGTLDEFDYRPLVGPVSTPAFQWPLCVGKIERLAVRLAG